MKAEEITAGNILLAEFMGRRGKRNKHLFWVNIPGVSWVTDEQLEFDSNWNWLMPVVEKIEEVGGGGFYSVTIIKQRCKIRNEDRDLLFTLCDHAESKIESVFQACVLFAKWYRNQPSI